MYAVDDVDMHIRDPSLLGLKREGDQSHPLMSHNNMRHCIPCRDNAPHRIKSPMHNRAVLCFIVPSTATGQPEDSPHHHHFVDLPMIPPAVPPADDPWRSGRQAWMGAGRNTILTDQVLVDEECRCGWAALCGVSVCRLQASCLRREYQLAPRHLPGDCAT